MQRDAKGRFVKGSTGNPKGRPPRATEQEYQDAVKDTIPIQRFIRMLEKQAQRAERGDIRAFDCVVRLIGVEAAKKLDFSGGARIQVEYVNTPYPTSGLSSSTGEDNQEPDEV